MICADRSYAKHEPLLTNRTLEHIMNYCTIRQVRKTSESHLCPMSRPRRRSPWNWRPAMLS
jgi:hypothetical protein